MIISRIFWMKQAPADMEGTAVTPAANNLFTINDDAEKLDSTKSDYKTVVYVQTCKG
jgi:hypothetical protein